MLPGSDEAVMNAVKNVVKSAVMNFQLQPTPQSLFTEVP